MTSTVVVEKSNHVKSWTYAIVVIILYTGIINYEQLKFSCSVKPIQRIILIESESKIIIVSRKALWFYRSDDCLL